MKASGNQSAIVESNSSTSNQYLGLTDQCNKGTFISWYHKYLYVLGEQSQTHTKVSNISVSMSTSLTLLQTFMLLSRFTVCCYVLNLTAFLFVSSATLHSLYQNSYYYSIAKKKINFILFKTSFSRMFNPVTTTSQ